MIYFDCGMGAAGDMLCAALYEVLDEKQKHSFLDSFAALGIPNVTLTHQQSVRCGIKGTRFVIMIDGEAEETQGEHLHHGHEQEHENSSRLHRHHHTTMKDIEGIVSHLNASERVKQNTIEVYRLIAAAESEAHGVNVEEVHFHEVGAMDAVADVAAFSLLVEMLGYPRIAASAINCGSGFVRCAHGTLPVPAPATALLLKGIPFYTSSIKTELCTPTGAALLRRFASSFDTHENITACKVGYGMGTRELEALNCVRAFLCEEGGTDEVCTLECEIDDMTGEEIAFACKRLMEEGALDVHTVPVFMKKGRPGISLKCLCAPSAADKTAVNIFALTTTLGIRKSILSRYVMQRSVCTAENGIRIKRAAGYGITRSKCEADDVEQIARKTGKSYRQCAKCEDFRTDTELQ